MTEVLTPTTELEAVNTMLSMIGEMPVNSVDTSSLTEASIAAQTLYSVSRQVQSEGLNCNTEYDYPMVPDGSKQIAVPEDVISIDATDRTKDIIAREGYLYNRTDHTKQFNGTVMCDIVWLLKFEDLPEHVRQFIMIRAGRIFQKKMVGSKLLFELTQEEEAQARANMRSREVENEDHNMLTGFLARQGSIRRGSVW